MKKSKKRDKIEIKLTDILVVGLLCTDGKSNHEEVVDAGWNLQPLSNLTDIILITTIIITISTTINAIINNSQHHSCHHVEPARSVDGGEELLVELVRPDQPEADQADLHVVHHLQEDDQSDSCSSNVENFLLKELDSLSGFPTDKWVGEPD